MRAAAEKAAASEGTRDFRPSKMLSASLEAKSPGSPLHSTKVSETSLMQVSATYKEDELDS